VKCFSRDESYSLPEVNGEEAQQLVRCVSSSFSLSRVLLSVFSEGKLSAKINMTFARYQVFSAVY